MHKMASQYYMTIPCLLQQLRMHHPLNLFCFHFFSSAVNKVPLATHNAQKCVLHFLIPKFGLKTFTVFYYLRKVFSLKKNYMVTVPNPYQMKVTDGWGSYHHSMNRKGLKRVMEKIELARYFLFGHGSEACHGNDQSLPQSLEVRVLLWVNALGSGKYSNPIKMVLECWLCLEFSSLW